jgi:hypothetical protein
MAKFIPLSGYYLGYHKQKKSRFINVDHIEYVEPSAENSKHTWLVFDPYKILVIEQPLDEVMLLLSRR